MRKGNNPAKRAQIKAYRPGRIGIVSLNYLPTLKGYFSQGREILELHLRSLRYTAPNIEIWVFDNGSCSSVQTFLQHLHQEGVIDHLLLSRRNWGKMPVVQWALRALPHDYIGFTDGDLLFLPRWLERSLEIFRAYPQAGMVGIFPNFFREISISQMQQMNIEQCRKTKHYICSGFATANALRLTYRIIHPAPSGPLRIFLKDVGAGFDATTTPLHWAMALHDDTRVPVSIGVRDFFFLVPREIARKIPEFTVRRALSPHNEWIHFFVAEMGYLLLSTPKGYVRHMGNSLDGLPFLQSYIKQLTKTPLQSSPISAPFSSSISSKRKMLRLGQYIVQRLGLRPFLEEIYHVLFALLFSDSLPYKKG